MLFLVIFLGFSVRLTFSWAESARAARWASVTTVATTLVAPLISHAGIDPSLLEAYKKDGTVSAGLAPLTGPTLTMKDIEKLKAIEDSFVAREVEFQKCPLGASFREFRAGRENSKALSIGDRAVVEMTVRCKKLATAKEVGGVKYYSTKDDSPSNSFTFVVGDGTVPPALEEALVGMKRGAIRRVELPSVLVFEARNKGQLPQPTTEKGKRVFKNLFKTDATLIFEVLVDGIKSA